MNRQFIIFCISIILITPQAWGYANANRQTMWNNFTDAIHTIGKNPQQKRTTLMRLHYMRAKARLNSMIKANRDKSLATAHAWMSGNN